MKTLTLATLTLVFLPGLAFAMGCAGEHTTDTAQMSCAEGTVINTETNTCDPITMG